MIIFTSKIVIIVKDTNLEKSKINIIMFFYRNGFQDQMIEMTQISDDFN